MKQTLEQYMEGVRKQQHADQFSPSANDLSDLTAQQFAKDARTAEMVHGMEFHIYEVKFINHVGNELTHQLHVEARNKCDEHLEVQEAEERFKKGCPSSTVLEVRRIK